MNNKETFLFIVDKINRSLTAQEYNPKIIIVGSQSIFGHIENTESEYINNSKDVDFLLKEKEEQDIVNAFFGELSELHKETQKYADGVDIENLILPKKFNERLVNIKGLDFKAYSLNIHDLIAAKLFVQRNKDMDFIYSAIMFEKEIENYIKKERIENSIKEFTQKQLSMRNHTTQSLLDDLTNIYKYKNEYETYFNPLFEQILKTKDKEKFFQIWEELKFTKFFTSNILEIEQEKKFAQIEEKAKELNIEITLPTYQEIDEYRKLKHKSTIKKRKQKNCF